MFPNLNSETAALRILELEECNTKLEEKKRCKILLIVNINTSYKYISRVNLHFSHSTDSSPEQQTAYIYIYIHTHTRGSIHYKQMAA